MDYIWLKARAKINLAIDVLGKRPDGYHDLRMVMQSLALYDRVLIKKYSKAPIKLAANSNRLPVDSRNLAYKAAEYLLNEYNIDSGVLISLEKNIPISAGLAGGSSDCAAVLIGMRRLFGLNIRNEELLRIGRMFGADVPFCIVRGTALAEGVGDELTKLSPHPRIHVLLARPPVSVSTASVFKAFDPCKSGVEDKRPDVDKLIKALEAGELKTVTRYMGNVLETVTEDIHPVIADVKRVMLNYGALCAMMSGSGPTVFGYFQDKESAVRAAEQIRIQTGTVKDLYLTGVYNNYAPRMWRREVKT